MTEVRRTLEETIRIEVGPDRITNPEKEDVPLPEFRYEQQFEVRVVWNDPAEGLSTTLWDFVIVKFVGESDSHPCWVVDETVSLRLLNENREELEELVLRYTGDRTTSERITLERVYGEGYEPGPNRVVMFEQKVSRGQDTLFTLDPPWVGKPPAG